MHDSVRLIVARAAPLAPCPALLRVARPVLAIATGMLLGGCELPTWVHDPAATTSETAATVARGPAPLPPPPRPRRPSRLQAAAPAKSPPVAQAPPMAAPARPRVAVSREPVAPIAPPVAAPGMQGGAGDEPVHPPPPPDIDPAGLVGRSEAQLEQALGKPLRQERVASGVNWIYDRPDCHASFLLLPEVTSGERRVFAYEVTPRGRDAPSAAACLGRIAADGPSRRS